jgi:3-hydroxyisobutyrate dehydrogenase-like beta-hydroxyacid dehydrogenase
MSDGGIIILTATIRPSEAREIGEALADTGIRMIDSPVSGGFPGAQNGTLTMMAAAPDELMTAAKPVM